MANNCFQSVFYFLSKAQQGNQIKLATFLERILLILL